MSNNLSPKINANIAQSEKDGGIFLKNLQIGDSVRVKTRNSLYTIRKTDAVVSPYTIEGHAKYCPKPTECNIVGSTWGGSMIKTGFIGLGMYLEFWTKEAGTVTTSQIRSIDSVLG